MAYKKYGIYGYECSKCGKFVDYSDNSVGSVVTNSNHSLSMSNSVKSWQTKHRRK